MGAGDIEGAKFYTNKLMKWTVTLAVSWNALVFIATPLFMQFYKMTPISR